MPGLAGCWSGWWACGRWESQPRPGLVLYFIGAVVMQLRARVFYNIAFPGADLLLSAASLALLVAH